MSLANPTKAEVLATIQNLDGDEEMTEVVIAALERMLTERPQVYVNVSGGVAEATVTRGDVEVLHVDWDDLNDGADLDQLEEYREYIERVADEKYRIDLLADIDRLIVSARDDQRDEERGREVRVRREELTKLRIAFDVMGGRGVDLAERIDTLEREIEEINERYEKESATK